ncbi:hypothetical protein [Arcobacter sp. LA11]|uniref:hypothetical protein n=1 Tax=Arcobacter sp. LA11 TaxID=1898176 RepID=UPI000932E2BC|nr:hypothetical protein [Arcobacter sp. LA11]
MQVIKKNLVYIFSIILVLSFFTGCASSALTKDSTLYFGKDKQSAIPIRFTNPIYKDHYSYACNVDSYTLLDDNAQYGQLFIEYIYLGFRCHWNGLPTSFFETNLRYELKIDTLETVEEFDIGTYNFKTYRIDNDTHLSMIYMFGGSTDRFILDYEGKFYTKLLKSFKPDYQNNTAFQKRFKGKYNDSLVRKNLINHYFSEERERFERDWR